MRFIRAYWPYIIAILFLLWSINKKKSIVEDKQEDTEEPTGKKVISNKIVNGKVAPPIFTSMEQLEKAQKKEADYYIFDGSHFFCGSNNMFITRQFFIGMGIAIVCLALDMLQARLMSGVFELSLSPVLLGIVGARWSFIPIGFAAMYTNSFIAAGFAGLLSQIFHNAVILGIGFVRALTFHPFTNFAYALGSCLLALWNRHDTSESILKKVVKAFIISAVGFMPSLLLSAIWLHTWDGLSATYHVDIPWAQTTIGMVIGMVIAHIYEMRKRRTK